MAEAMRVGVIGLGPLWRGEFLPALRWGRKRFKVVCVADAVARVAKQAARQLRCAAASGPADLFARHALDAVLILDAQWHKLWPLELACRNGVPALCCPTPDVEGERAAELLERIAASGVPVQFAMLPRLFPSLRMLDTVRGDQLGRPRTVLARAVAPYPALLDLVDWCDRMFEGEPASVRTTRAAGMTSLVLDYGAGSSAQLTAVEADAAPSLRIEVIAENGAAVVSSPYRLHSASGVHRRTWTHRESGAVGLPALGLLSYLLERRESGVPAMVKLLARLGSSS